MTPPPDRDDLDAGERVEDFDVDFFDVEARGFLLGPRVLMSGPTVPTAARTTEASDPSGRPQRYGHGMTDGTSSGRLGASGAAGGNAGGPSMPGRKGPTNRSDLMVAVAAIAIVAAVVLFLALR